MAFSANGGGYGSRRNRGGQALSEINVTPFVDVVLVLLIIFMLTAHAMDYGLKVDVPKVRQVSSAVEDLPIVSIPKDGTTYLGDKPININDLKTEIPRRFGADSKSVYVKADRETTYEIIAQVIAQLSADGFQSRLVTQPMDAAKGRK